MRVIRMPGRTLPGGPTATRTGGSGGNSGGGNSGGAGGPSKGQKFASDAWEFIKKCLKAPGFKGWMIILAILFAWNALMKVKARFEGIAKPASRAAEIADRTGATLEELRKKAAENLLVKKFDEEIEQIKKKVADKTATPEEVEALQEKIRLEIQKHEPPVAGEKVVWDNVITMTTPSIHTLATDEVSFGISSNGPITITVGLKDGSSRTYQKDPGDTGRMSLNGVEVEGITGKVDSLAFQAKRPTKVLLYTRKF